MTGIRLALAQLNPTVGDIDGNCGQIMAAARQAHSVGADMLVTPEMMVPGYPIEDLALRRSFADACSEATGALARELQVAGMADLTVVVGTLGLAGGTSSALGRPAHEPVNAAWVLLGGEVGARYAKHHLPNYGVFDEFRYFVSGTEPTLLDVAGQRVALAICEDLWQEGGPVTWAREAESDLLVVLNGSPFEEEKHDTRLELCQSRAREAGCALAYVNMVGGQDELVFGGDSMVVNAAGKLLARAAPFSEELLVVDLDSESHAGTHVASPTTAQVQTDRATLSSHSPMLLALQDAKDPNPFSMLAGTDRKPDGPNEQAEADRSDSALVYGALRLGLRDYVRKNGFRTVILGLSGGIDSALSAALACDAVGAENVFGVSMPSAYSSQHSQDDAHDLARRTGLNLRTIPIEDLVTAFRDPLDLSGLAEENLQARVRGVTLMALSNSEGHLVLATGNKTEISVGYSTIYGDAVGGFAPIKDVSKTQVWQLSRWRNEQATLTGKTPPIPEASIEKPPSAELRPDQLDSDSLPDYALLDGILDAYVEQDLGADQVAAMGFDPAVVREVIRMTDAAEYKRRQYPPGTKITLKAFGRDRRLPITNRWREH